MPNVSSYTLSATEIQRTTFGCCTWITWCQNGTLSPRPLGPYRARRRSQISCANSLRRSGGVARIISTAAFTGMASDWPFMLNTAVSHAPRLAAPSPAGLYCTVSRPILARRSVFAQRTLQLRHVQRRLAGSPCSSWPSRWPISMFRRLPQSAQIRVPGGGLALARYRSALSVTVSLRQRRPPAGQVSPGRLRPRLRPLRTRCPGLNRACH